VPRPGAGGREYCWMLIGSRTNVTQEGCLSTSVRIGTVSTTRTCGWWPEPLAETNEVTPRKLTTFITTFSVQLIRFIGYQMVYRSGSSPVSPITASHGVAHPRFWPNNAVFPVLPAPPCETIRL